MELLKQKIKQVEFTDLFEDKFIIHYVEWPFSNDRIGLKIMDVEYQNHGEWIQSTGKEFREKFPLTWNDIDNFMDDVE